MKKHKIFLTVISVFVLISVCVTAFAVVGAKKPDVTSGKTENLIADRISVIFENTQFNIRKNTSAEESYTLTAYLTVNKTQGDFYGIINSITLSGIDYDNIVYTALSPAAEGKTLEKLTLTATDGSPDIYKWQIDVTVSVSEKGEADPEFIIDYTSGTEEYDAQQKLMRIPLKITVE